VYILLDDVRIYKSVEIKDGAIPVSSFQNKIAYDDNEQYAGKLDYGVIPCRNSAPEVIRRIVTICVFFGHRLGLRGRGKNRQDKDSKSQYCDITICG